MFFFVFELMLVVLGVFDECVVVVDFVWCELVVVGEYLVVDELYVVD